MCERCDAPILTNEQRRLMRRDGMTVYDAIEWVEYNGPDRRIPKPEPLIGAQAFWVGVIVLGFVLGIIALKAVGV